MELPEHLLRLLPEGEAASVAQLPLEKKGDDERRAIYELSLPDPTSPSGETRIGVLFIKQVGVILGRHLHLHQDYPCPENFLLIQGALTLRTRVRETDPLITGRFEAPCLFVIPPGVTHELVTDGPAVLVALTPWPYIDKGEGATTHPNPLPPA